MTEEKKIYEENKGTGTQSGAKGGLPCHVVRDLLPLYIDGLTGEQTSRDIRTHLDGCEDCSKQYKAMTAGPDLTADKASAEHAQAGKEIDYLKKVRKRSKLPAIIIACAALLVLGGLAARFFIFGSRNNSAVISADVKNEREITLDIELMDSALALSGTDISEKDGVVTVEAKSVLVGLRKSSKGTATYTAKEPIKQVVDASGKVLWESGLKIEPYVGAMFADKVKYLGNASAVGKLVRSTCYSGLEPMLTGQMKLGTSAEPYYLILYTEGNSSYVKESQLKQGALLLALIENLDEVRYVYQLKNDAGDVAGEVLVTPMTSRSAYEWVRELAVYNSGPAGDTAREAKNIKDFGKSASALQALVEILQMDLSDAAVPVTLDQYYYAAVMKLGLDPMKLSTIVGGRSNVVSDIDGNRVGTFSYVNGDELLYVCAADGKVLSATYLDKTAKLRLEWKDGWDSVRKTEL